MAFGFFEPSKGETPQSIKRQREVARALARRVAGPTPRNVGEGIGLVGTDPESLEERA